MTGPSYRGLYCFGPQTMVGVLKFPFPDENIQSLERLLKGHGKPSGYPFMGERRTRLFGSRPRLLTTGGVVRSRRTLPYLQRYTPPLHNASAEPIEVVQDARMQS